MDKTFDELFNEFFKRKKTKSNDGFESSMTEMHKKIIDMLTNFTQNDNIENIIDNTSFDIRATPVNNATGVYTATYKITY